MRIHETTDFKSKATLYNFLEWWKTRAGTTGPGQEDINRNTQFLSKINVEADGTINCGWKINIVDHKSTFLPFKFGKVAGMRLQMKNLASLVNTPRECQMFTVECSQLVHNDKLHSLKGGPERCQHMSFELGGPIESLECGLTHECESIWIECPEIKTFTGLTVPVGDLGFKVLQQQSISSIKHLRNIGALSLMLPQNFEGGMLGIALIPGLISVAGGGAQTKDEPWNKALNIIDVGIKRKQNVHDIQENLIEAGFHKFARL